MSAIGYSYAIGKPFYTDHGTNIYICSSTVRVVTIGFINKHMDKNLLNCYAPG